MGRCVNGTRGHRDYQALASLIMSSITNIIISWVPGHYGIPVNEMTDDGDGAKSSFRNPLLLLIPIIYFDFYYLVSDHKSYTKECSPS